MVASFSNLSETDFSTDFYDFNKLNKPDWLVEGELSDLRWVIQTEDGSKKRYSKETIRFDIPIYPGPVRLSDPQVYHDLLTAKLLIYWSLHPSTGWCSSATVVYSIYRYFLTFVRWKWNRGIRYNADLTPEWLTEFQTSLSRDGLEGLIRSDAAIKSVLEALYSNPSAIPTRMSRGVVMIERAKIYELAGLTAKQQLSDEARAQMSKFVNHFGLSEPGRIPQSSETADRFTGKRSIDRKNLHYCHLRGYLAVWWRLWELRSRLSHDSIGFEPFEDYRVAGLLARAIENREQSRTPSAPAEQTCYLIDRAILWVLYYGEDIKRFVEALNEVASNHRIRLQADAVALVQESFKPKYSGEGFPSAPWPVEGLRGPISADSKGLPLYTVMYGHLAVSCALIIAAFSARRKEEIVSLTDGCVSEVDGDYLLEVWIEKTLRHQQKVPVPAIVARAVETLQWLSMTHRKRTKEKWLFGFDTLIPFRGKSRLVGFGFPQVLREFAEYVGVPALPDGTYWHFTPHQFRRFFSIVYFYRYRYPSLSALSEYLRHFNPDTTRQYISEVSQGSFARLSEESKVDQDLWSVMQRDAQRNLDEISETSQEFKVEVLTEALNNPDKMRGFGGDKLRAELQKKLDEAENKFRIGSKPPDDPSRTLDEIIIAFANSCTIEPKGFGHSYCKCSTSQLDLEVAACVQEGQEGQDGKGPIVGPDNRFVADLTCSKCVHNVQLPENEMYWRDLIEKQLRQVKQAHAGLSRDVQKRRLDLATEHYERNFGPWEDRVRHEK